jgi:hypothetical protein
MPNPTVPFKILAKGYKVRGGQDGLHATVPCLVDWSNAFLFHDEVLGYPIAPAVGPILYNLPWKFPGAPLAYMYAVSCEIEPIGQDGQPLALTQGMTPGEYFKLALCTVDFQNRTFIQTTTDDPGGINQLDPDQPLVFCTQEVSGGAKMVTRKGLGYQYDGGVDNGKPVIGDLGVVEPECKLQLTFPWVPFMPWQQLQGFVGCVNQVPVLGCAVGTLLFEDFNVRAQATTVGLQGQEVKFGLAWQPNQWNMVPNSKGTPTLVLRADGSGNRIYLYQDLSEIFF